MALQDPIYEAELNYDGKKLSMPVYEGSEGERAVDIAKLRKETGLITYDPGYVNTGACDSAITYIDGEKGILRHRGYAIEDLAENCSFVDVAYLLVHGSLPKQDQKNYFSFLLRKHAMVHESMIRLFQHYPSHAHPMGVLSAMVVSMSAFYPELDNDPGSEELNISVTRLLSKLRTLATYAYKHSVGKPIVYPKTDMKFGANFLNMMFGRPDEEPNVDPVLESALNKLLIIHADHEQNCSTSTVRLIGSSGANLYASISGGIGALWGPLHGGANQAVMEMLASIHDSDDTVKKTLERAKDKNDPFRLMGFGHRVYKSYDPRAKIAKKACDEVLAKLGVSDPLLDVAKELEMAALEDDYFKERNLYPNVDFYTGIIYRAMGFPTNMFTVLFALGRLPGWISHWMEFRDDPHNRIGRPRQVYTGPNERKVIPIGSR